jgi:hypothetical protein
MRITLRLGLRKIFFGAIIVAMMLLLRRKRDLE